MERHHQNWGCFDCSEGVLCLGFGLRWWVERVIGKRREECLKMWHASYICYIATFTQCGLQHWPDRRCIMDQSYSQYIHWFLARIKHLGAFCACLLKFSLQELHFDEDEPEVGHLIDLIESPNKPLSPDSSVSSGNTFYSGTDVCF